MPEGSHEKNPLKTEIGKHDDSLVKGYALNIVYAILTAIAIVFLSHVGAEITMMAALFYMALGSSIVFNLTELSRFKTLHQAVLRHWHYWLGMSVAFILNWIFSYYSATHSTAEFYISVFFLTSAFCASLRARDNLKVVVCLLAIYIAYVLTQAPIDALIAAVLAGISVYFYFVYSHSFATRANLSANSVVAVRCYLLALATFGYLLINDELTKLIIPLHQIPELLFLILFNMIIPSFLSQTCLHKVGVTRFTQINSLIPVIAFVLQTLFLNEWRLPILLMCILATLALNHQFFLKRQEKSRK
ncbi:EamA family transporter [Pseudomonas cichorii]|uniref:EamA family transporter n=1 Tax=Pseudomonas cichorii TaxID=36746 RepID=UPI0018E5C70D|nr:EamA family transporter [Pseudomonas cichorii]MBI6853476.1 EamA family transporter [Pseudomonas cichorii]